MPHVPLHSFAPWNEQRKKKNIHWQDICCCDEILHVYKCYLLLQLLLQLADDVLLLLHQGLQLLAPLKQAHLWVPGLTVWSLQLLLHPLHLDSHKHTLYMYRHTCKHMRPHIHSLLGVLTCWWAVKARFSASITCVSNCWIWQRKSTQMSFILSHMI